MKHGMARGARTAGLVIAGMAIGGAAVFFCMKKEAAAPLKSRQDSPLGIIVNATDSAKAAAKFPGPLTGPDPKKIKENKARDSVLAQYEKDKKRLVSLQFNAGFDWADFYNYNDHGQYRDHFGGWQGGDLREISASLEKYEGHLLALKGAYGKMAKMFDEMGGKYRSALDIDSIEQKNGMANSLVRRHLRAVADSIDAKLAEVANAKQKVLNGGVPKFECLYFEKVVMGSNGGYCLEGTALICM